MQSSLTAAILQTVKVVIKRLELLPDAAAEINKVKLRVKSEKTALSREIDELEGKVKEAEAERDNVTNDRLKLLALEKKANSLRREYMKKHEGQFFDSMRLDLELEQRIKEFNEREKLTARVTREFILKVEGNDAQYF